LGEEGDVAVGSVQGAGLAPKLARLASPKTATVVGVATLLPLVAGVPLTIVTSDQLSGVLAVFAVFALLVPFGVVGLLIGRRQPRNPIGWIMFGVVVAITVSTNASSYAVFAFRMGHPGLPLARLAVALTQCWIALPMLLPLPVLLFPTGRVPSRRWRVTLWVYLAICVTFLIGFATKDVAAFTERTVQVDSSGELVTMGQTGKANPVVPVLFVVFVLISLSWVVRQIVAYRRATGDLRQQLKWLMSGGATAIIGFGQAVLFGNSSSAIVRALSLVGFFGFVAVPVALGVGILKYRLYDIDRIISRTVAYATVTGLLIGVYVAMIALTTRVIPLSSSVGVAASTLAAVGLFTPLRRRIQQRVDRRFNRANYDSAAMVSAFTSRLRDAVQLETVRTDLLTMVSAAVEPAHVALWIRPISR
jgi:hypothetical protein